MGQRRPFAKFNSITPRKACRARRSEIRPECCHERRIKYRRFDRQGRDNETIQFRNVLAILGEGASKVQMIFTAQVPCTRRPLIHTQRSFSRNHKPLDMKPKAVHIWQRMTLLRSRHGGEPCTCLHGCVRNESDAFSAD